MLPKTRKIKIILFAAIIASITFAVFFCFSNQFALAQVGEEAVENINVPRAELVMSIIKIINYVLGFLALIAVILVIYAGFMWMTAGGNTEQVDKAKKILINALIGLAIIILSVVITMYVFNVLENRIAGAGGGGGGNGNGGGGNGGGLPQNIFKISSIVTSCNNPPNYNQAVHRCSAVVVNFNHQVDTNDINSAINDNSLRIENCGFSSTCSNPTNLNQAYAGSLSSGSGNEWTAKGRSITFTHQDLFAANNYYRLIIPKDIRDKSGLEIDSSDACGTGLNTIPGCVSAGTEYRWTFQVGTTMDTTLPSISSTYPINQDNPGYPDVNVNLRPVLWARFNEGVLPASINKTNIKIKTVSGAFLGEDEYEVEINSEGNGFEIYDLILEPFIWYEIRVSGVKDLCNNTMAGTKVWQFQTNDTAPGVKKVYPTDGYQNACPDANIAIYFNTSMYNPLNASCDVLSSGGSYVTSGSLSPAVTGRYLQVVDDYPGAGADSNKYCKQYEFLPISAELNIDTTYTARVNTNLPISSTGSTLNHSWSFKVKSFEQCIDELEGQACSAAENICTPDSNLCASGYLCDETCRCRRQSGLTESRVIDWWPRSCNAACRNTSIGTEFNVSINKNSLTTVNINVFSCQDSSCDWDNLGDKISLIINYLEAGDGSYQLDVDPRNNLEANTYYRVILKDDILSSQGQNLSNLNFSTDGAENNSFSWVFATKNEICELDNVEVKPAEATLNRIGGTQAYRAYALGRGLDNCDGAPLNSSSYNWQWSSSNSGVATVSGTQNPNTTAKAVSNGQTNIRASTSGSSATGLLTVDTTTNNQPCDNEIDGPEQCNQPTNSLCTDSNFPFCSPVTCKCVSEIPAVNILSFAPTGQQVCTNLVGNVLFDQIMNQSSIQNNLELSSDNDPVEMSLKFNKIKSGEQGCLNSDDCTQVRIYPKNVLEKDKTYKITITGGSSGVKSSQGGALSVTKNWTFTTLATAEICQINKVEIVPSSFVFAQTDQSWDFEGVARAKDGQQITNVPTIYDWTWQWSKVDEMGIIDITNSDDEIETVTANNVNGQAILIATASISKDLLNYTEGKKYIGRAKITNFICLNPWPVDPPYEDTSGFSNFSLFYCQDKGLEGFGDDLPALSGPNISSNPSPGTLREYFLLRDDESTDAIGIRIFDNPEHLSPQTWYETQGFTGTSISLQVDGYEAIQDGRSVYVSATTLSGSRLYTNIYLISYNENASTETIEIYNKLLDNWTFNINLTDSYPVCSDNLTYCTLDSDCPQNTTCQNDKAKLIRDTKRVTDLGALKKYITDYKNQNDYYPKLEAGSYEQGHSTSKWPSWAQTLGPALGKSLAVDPINEFDSCPVDYDQESCWNETTKDFQCPAGTHIYQYQTLNSGQTYNLYGTMEYRGANWSPVDYVWQKNDSCEDFKISN